MSKRMLLVTLLVALAPVMVGAQEIDIWHAVANAKVAGPELDIWPAVADAKVAGPELDIWPAVADAKVAHAVVKATVSSGDKRSLKTRDGRVVLDLNARKRSVR